MNTRQISVAIIGIGKMGQHHAAAASSVSGARIVAVVDPMATQEEVDASFTGAKHFAEAAGMLSDVRPDVVHICTPPSSHATLIAQCIEHGANVYVEKPVCEDVATLERLLALAAERQVLICAGHQLLAHPTMRRLRDRLSSIGRVVHIDSYFSFRKVRKNLTMVGQAIDILPHPTYLLVDALQHAAPGQSIELHSMLCSVDGEVRAMLRAGSVTASLHVSLAERPVDHYLSARGTSGSLTADFVRGSLIELEGPGAGFLPMITIPFSHAKQTWMGGLRSILDRVRRRGGAYPGLREIISEFYSSVRAGGQAPTNAEGLRATVEACERIGKELERLEAEREAQALVRLSTAPMPTEGSLVLVTGGRGFLGRVVVEQLRQHGYRVRVASRTLPPATERVPGVEYSSVDLSRTLASSVLDGVEQVVHCAAASEPGEAAHKRGTIEATANLLAACKQAGISRFVHISSLAVLKPGGSRSRVSEVSPVDRGNKGRGPYVWAKAEAEFLVSTAHAAGDVNARIVRPGPIVDYGAWDPPGRLGRDLGSLFVAVGSPGERLSVVQVQTVAVAIVKVLSRFEQAPLVVNLVEPDAPTRGALVKRSVEAKPGLRVIWIPGWAMGLLSPLAITAQRRLLKMKSPINLAAAFSTELYETSVARSLLSGD